MALGNTKWDFIFFLNLDLKTPCREKWSSKPNPTYPASQKPTSPPRWPQERSGKRGCWFPSGLFPVHMEIANMRQRLGVWAATSVRTRERSDLWEWPHLLVKTWWPRFSSTRFATSPQGMRGVCVSKNRNQLNSSVKAHHFCGSLLPGVRGGE